MTKHEVEFEMASRGWITHCTVDGFRSGPWSTPEAAHSSLCAHIDDCMEFNRRLVQAVDRLDFED